MRIQVSGARLLDPASGIDQICDIFIEGGKVAALGEKPSGFSVEQLIDARNLIAAPGLVDINASLREPGYGRKGNIASETRAAAGGGVTSLCCTPFTKPVLDTPAVAELILDQARDHGSSRVYPLGAFTQGLAGDHLAELVTLRDAGCVAFTNGLVPFANNRLLRHALEYASTFGLTVIFQPQDRDLAEGGIAHESAATNFRGLSGIPETAETVALARDLLLVEHSGVRAHFSQITTARGAELIARAQQRGLNVTADVAMYQLILTDEALLDFSSLYHVQPPCVRWLTGKACVKPCAAASSAPLPATTSRMKQTPNKTLCCYRARYQQHRTAVAARHEPGAGRRTGSADSYCTPDQRTSPGHGAERRQPQCGCTGRPGTV